jgi:hypothetical protein
MKLARGLPYGPTAMLQAQKYTVVSACIRVKVEPK